MKIDENTSREELATIVSEALAAAGFGAVLVGGSVVSIYTKELFPSDDLDFVVNRRPIELEPTLRLLGFDQLVNNIAIHPAARYYVQLLNDTVAVGAKQPIRPVDLKTSVGMLRTLSPLDCVLDRLAAFLHYNDRPCLRQAVEVALQYSVPVDEVRQWFDAEPAPAEKKAEKLNEFVDRLEKLKLERGSRKR